ncbi:MAG: DUF4440 domain-containing protein [Saprospiraceae bacterium]|nr:DUF4440 domain-containing protein [Saprospiraceae bacterium]
MSTILKGALAGLLMIAGSLLPAVSTAQTSSPESAIRQILSEQAAAWNKGDMAGFMQHYWKSDDLQFLGASGLTKGWQATLDRYKKAYPDVQSMGKLTFDLHEINRRSETVYSVIGQYHLSREGLENLSGHFLLIVQSIAGKWLIVADSTH